MIKHLYELIPLLIDKKKLKVVVVMAHDDHVIEAIAKVVGALVYVTREVSTFELSKCLINMLPNSSVEIGVTIEALIP